MTEEERQEAFREEVRGYLAKDKATLDNLVARVDKLEKTVVHGNGNPSLTVQIAAMQVQIDTFRGELKEVKDKMGSLDEMRTDIASIKTTMSAKEKNNSAWIMFGLTILAIVATPIIEHFFIR